jgi:hypothetical protein
VLRPGPLVDCDGAIDEMTDPDVTVDVGAV